MLGAIIGDVVGSRFEFNNIKTKKFDLFDKKCKVTDDSVMSVAVAEITEGVVPDVEAERVRDHGRVSVRSRLTVSQRLSDVHLSEIGAGLLGKITGRDRVTKAQVRGDTEVGSVFHTGVLLGGKCRNT